MQLGHIDLNKLRGIADKAAGFAKELTGTLIGNENLEKAGEAQQDKASEQLKAMRKEVEAQQHEAKADLDERRQKAAQRDKSAAG